MRKILAVFALMALFLAGCESESGLKLDINDTIPDDVNISKSETNITIDDNLPPEPAIEG